MDYSSGTLISFFFFSYHLPPLSSFEMLTTPSTGQAMCLTEQPLFLSFLSFSFIYLFFYAKTNLYDSKVYKRNGASTTQPSPIIGWKFAKFKMGTTAEYHEDPSQTHILLYDLFFFFLSVLNSSNWYYSDCAESCPTKPKILQILSPLNVTKGIDNDDAEKITSEPHGPHVLLTRTCTTQKLKTLRGVPMQYQPNTIRRSSQRNLLFTTLEY